MKRSSFIIATAVIFTAIFAFAGARALAHDETHPESMQAVLPGQYFADVSGVGAHPTLDPVSTKISTTELFTSPEYATNCRGNIRPSRTSAVGVCYNYSGSGNWKFQIAALAYDGCYRYVWMYGSVGYPWVPGKNTTAKWSYVYTPPGLWRFVAFKVVVWKP